MQTCLFFSVVGDTRLTSSAPVPGMVWYGTSTEDSVLLAELAVNEIAVLATGVYTQYINIW